MFYRRFRETYPWLPTRVIKGAYRDAVRRARSFREARKRGRAYTGKPEVRSVTITYSDSQDWRVGGGVIKLRMHTGWVELQYRNHKQLHKHLYGGWRLAGELKIKLDGGRIIAYLAFKKIFEVEYDPGSVVAVDVNENNVTIAVFKGRTLKEVYRVETGLGRIVIAYAERRRRITENRSTTTREVKKRLRRLRERRRKLDVLRKTAKIIERLATENKAVVVIGGIDGRAKEEMEDRSGRRLRHRIHQWSSSTLIKLLEEKPVHVVRVSERGSSSVDSFSQAKIKKYTPLVISIAVKGGRRVRILKVVFRIARVNDRLLERDVVGSINIGVRYLSSDGSPVALGSTGAHEVWVRLMIPHRGATPLAVIQLAGKRIDLHGGRGWGYAAVNRDMV